MLKSQKPNASEKMIGYLINRTPSSILNGKTPFEIIYGQAPEYEHLRVLGSFCFAHIQGKARISLPVEVAGAFFVGYPYGKKGWRLYDLETREFFVSRDVDFYETKFPYAILEKGTTNDIMGQSLFDYVIDEEFRIDGDLVDRGGTGMPMEDIRISRVVKMHHMFRSNLSVVLKAMQREIQALENNETWEIEDLPPGKKALGCKWVYKIKYNFDGTVERNKARLVIFGNHQIEGIDYTDTFAQLQIWSPYGHSWPLQPPRSGSYIRWTFIMPSCMGISKKRGVVQVNVLVYVDDLIISENNHASIQRFKTYLNEYFHMKDLGALKYFLGVEVTRAPEGILLCQRKYALDIIYEVGLLGAKLASVPLEQNHQLALATGRLIDDPECYRRLVGHLIYLCFTRPELSYCVHVLSQFMQQPREEHWKAALRVVRYLKGNPG
ncbi:hypothetical protein RJ640_013289 [Escallonia rubra]|uniref:Reverse transcriptase Ty1/copia-type domain-containing protein n=1 Tax=Escallonia rubra TaxID=112253 RepID=A0AA88RC75_9ASTE|nr:hypothetical protein RJ640_013289 [Escallonia rubra]